MAKKTGLDALSPAYREQYEAAIPEIQRKARAAAQARGMFYSGDATDAETRAEADLLAKLSGESAAATQQSSENEKNRTLEREQISKQDAATKRAQTLGIVGAGFGALGTGAGLLALHPGGNINNVIMGQDGKPYLINMKTGAMTPATMPAAGVGGSSLSAAPGAGVGGLDSIPSMTDPSLSSGGFSVAGGGTGVGMPAVAGAGAAGIGATAAPPSMWTNAKNAGVAGLAAGAAGGLTGNALSAKIGGGHSLAGDIGSGVGGLGGGLLALKMSGGNPWLAGLGALGGSLGGGLIGNLFK